MSSSSRDPLMGMLPPRAAASEVDVFMGMLPPRRSTPKLIPKLANPPSPRGINDDARCVWSVLDDACESPEDRAAIALVDLEKKQKVGLSLSSVEYTARALRLEVRTLAHSLMRKGIHRGDAVALVLDNVAASVVAAYAIAGLGAKSVHVNTRLSSDEIASRLHAADVRVIITGDRYASKIARAVRTLINRFSDLNGVDSMISLLFVAPPGATTIEELALPEYDDVDLRRFMDSMVDVTRVSFDVFSASRPGVDHVVGGTDAFDVLSESDEPCLSLLNQLERGHALRWTPLLSNDVLLDCDFQVMFSSGTSGEPKLVSHTQRQVISHANSVATLCKFSSTDCWLHVSPIFHAMDAFAMYACIAAGAKQVTMASDVFDVEMTLQAMQATGTTLSALTATHLQMLIGHESFPEAAKTLRLLSIGGSIVPAELVRSLQNTLPSKCLVFADYGATEACGKICTTIGTMSADYDSIRRAGWAMPLFDVAVVKDPRSMEPVEWNDEERGQVLVRGMTIGHGDGTWLALGDIATVDSNGSVRIVDRSSNIIIVGGENVYASEVESAVLELPGVAECAVFGVPDDALGEVCCCALVFSDVQVSFEEISKHCVKRLADFKRPQNFITVESLPKTPTGKTIKRELRLLYDSHKILSPTVASQLSLSELECIVREEFSRAMEWDNNMIANFDANFMTLGVRSTQAVAFARSLSERVHVDLPSTLLYDHPNLKSVMMNIVSKGSRNTPQTYNSFNSGVNRKMAFPNLSVIDVHSKFPCDVEDAQREIPLNRFDVTQRFICGDEFWKSPLGNSHVRFAATLRESIADEDVELSDLTPSEAPYVDPQQRLLLRQALPAIHLFNRTESFSASSSTIGVFVGCMWNDEYASTLTTFPCVLHAPNAVLALNSLAFQTGRIAYSANLSGPAIGVDTACSSSLVACSLGYDAIKLKLECDAALCAGTNLIGNSSLTLSKIARLNALAQDGRCKTLDSSADGYGRAEGVCSVLFASTKDGSYTCLIHVGLNQDAHSASLVAPRGSAQLHVIAVTLSQCTNTLATYELHGTGTQLGDPIEVAALHEALSLSLSVPGAVSITSVKSEIGHAEGAAGIAGVWRVLQSSIKSQITSIHHLKLLNPHISDVLRQDCAQRLSFCRIPGVIVQASGAHLGVSAFGMSGTNASALLRASAMYEDVVRVCDRRFFLNCTFWSSVSPPMTCSLLAASSLLESVIFDVRIDPRSDRGLHEFNLQHHSLLSSSHTLDLVAQAESTLLSRGRAACFDFILQSKMQLTGYSVTNGSAVVNLKTGQFTVRSKDEMSVAVCRIAKIRSSAHPVRMAPKRMRTNLRRSHMILASIKCRQTRDDRIDPTSLEVLHQTDSVTRRVRLLSAVSVACIANSRFQCERLVRGNVTIPRARVALGSSIRLMGVVYTPIITHTFVRARKRDMHYQVSWCANVNIARSAGTPSSKRNLCEFDQVSRPVDAYSCALMSIQCAKDSVDTFSLSASTFAPEDHALYALFRTAAHEFPVTRFRAAHSDTGALSDFETNQDVMGAVAEIRWCTKAACEPLLRRINVGHNCVLSPGLRFVVAGGLGGIGRAVTQWLSESLCDVEVNVLSRNVRRSSMIDVQRTTILFSAHACDLSLRVDAPQSVGGALQATLLHASGLLVDEALENKQRFCAQTVFASKLTAFENVDRNTGVLRALRSSTMCSSIAAAFGSRGQCNYSAANGVLDFIVEDKRDRGEPHSSVQWGAWRAVGMASKSERIISRDERFGLGSVDTADGIDVLCKLFSGWVTSLIVSPFDWMKLRYHTESPMFRDFIPTQRDHSNARKHLACMHGEDVLRRVRRVVEDVIGLALKVDDGFVASGLDSFAASELKSGLDSAFGIAFPATVSYDYPTIQALSVYVESRLQSTTASMQSLGLHAKSHISMETYTLMIVGSHLRSAGSGYVMDGISVAPNWRWDSTFWNDVRNTALPVASGFMDDCTRFDKELFNIPIVEALLLDPQQRTLLEGAYKLADVMSGTDARVFVGITSSNYKPDVISKYWGSFHSTMGTGNFPSVAAGRISFVFGYQGASMSIDTACSSSLVACALAFDAWNTSPVDSVTLVGGTMTIMSAAVGIDRYVSNMLSMDCRCKTLCETADGFVPGEATGLLVLLSVDLSDTFKASGVSVIAASVNQDGRSSGLTAPNGPSQQALIELAMRSSQLDRREIDGLHMHGTGTPLGDPIELGAAATVFRNATLAIEAAKSHVGHTETAAGILSLVRTYATTVGSHYTPPIMHLRSVNQHCTTTILESKCAFFIPREKACAVHAKSCRHKLVGITAFAFQGTNAHAIIQSRFSRTHATGKSALFEQDTFWPLPDLHPQLLAHSCVGDLTRFYGRIDPRAHRHLLDHVVAQRALFPGSGFQEICAASARMFVSCHALVRNSSIDAPLVMNASEFTTFVVKVSHRTGETRVASGSSLVHMRCFVENRCATRLQVKLTQFTTLWSRKRLLTSTACAVVPTRDVHIGYAVHPAALDNALQLGAIVNAGSGKLKVPTGARAYKSSESLSVNKFASVNGLNHSLEGTSLVGLTVKELRRTSVARVVSNAGTETFNDVYESRLFAVGTATRDTRICSWNRFHRSTAHELVCWALETIQNNVHSSSLIFRLSACHSGQAIRAAVGTAAQEIRGTHFESCLCAEDTSQIVHSPRLQADGAARETTVISHVIFESRLRRACKMLPWTRRHHIGTNAVHCPSDHGNENFLIITGGLGAIGLETARNFERENWRLVLLSRSGRASEFGVRSGPLVVAMKNDVSHLSSADLSSLRVRYCAQNTAERVFHAAGALADALIMKQTAGTVFVVMGAKRVAPTFRVAEATRAFLNCSSLAALTGNPGQMNYAAANACLDANARESRHFGRPETSILWGGWAEVGMAARDPAIVQRLERIGAGALDPKVGVEIIAAMLQSDSSRSWSVSRFDWTRIAKTLPAFVAFQDMLDAFATGAKAMKTGSVAKISQALNASNVQSKIAAVVRSLTGEDVSPDAPLMEAGLDSQAAGELVSALESEFPSIDVPATIVFDYPTMTALASHIIDISGLQDAAAVETIVTQVSHTSSARSEVVARISSAELLVPKISGDAISCVPYYRWDNSWFRDKEKLLMPSFSAFLTNYESFDSTLFGLASSETILMDVQQRSILEGVINTRLAVRAMSEDTLEGALCGVYVAISSMQYHVEVLNYYWPNSISPYVATGNTLSVAAGRVSFLFGLRGPCFSMDTACSSSIVATHLTVESLRMEDCTSAHVCGCITIIGPAVTAIFFCSGMLSPSGRCKTLDASADGYVRGEARGVFYVQAMEPNEMKSGVAIVGSAINQDGRSSSLTAPNGPSQQAVMKFALRSSGTTGGEVDKLQMHGTGTPLGDPIEVGATVAVLQRRSGEPLSLEAIKSHCGHTETASGMVALMQPLLSLVNETVEKILQLRWVNPHVESIVGKNHFVSSPRQNTPRAAKQVGVSSFAFQGTNANSIQRIITMGSDLCHPVVSPHLSREHFHPVPTLHPHLYAFSRSFTKGDNLSFMAKVSLQTHAHLLDHCVLDRALYPGAGFQELASGASRMFSAKHLVTTNSSVPAPMQLSTVHDTTFETHISPSNGRLWIQMRSMTFMRAEVRAHARNSPDSKRTLLQRKPNSTVSLEACGKVRALWASWHDDYFVDPACLDNALHLGAVMNAGSREMKVPVGVRAYTAQRISPKKHTLFARARNDHSNYSLESAHVVGLEVKSMRRSQSPASKQKRVIHELKWFASHPCSTGTCRLARLLESSASDAVLTAACAVQSNTTTGIDINAARSENNDAVHGFLRTVGQELTRLRTEGVRFDGERTHYVAPADSSIEFVAESYELIVTANYAYESRLRPIHVRNVQSHPILARGALGAVSMKHRNVLITGGLGAIGHEYAKHVQSCDDAHSDVHLLSRLGRSIDFHGAAFDSVRAKRCDAGCDEDVRSLARNEFDEVLHTAGILRDMIVQRQNAASFRVVIGAKVNTWLTLSNRLGGSPIHRVVQCSSIAALAGSSGQSNYSAANACLDSIALFDRHKGEFASSIQWGAWSDIGMADERVLQKVDSMGFGVVSPEIGMRTLRCIMSHGSIANVVATPYDFIKLAQSLPFIPSVYRDLAIKKEKKVVQRLASATRSKKARRGQLPGGQPLSEIRVKIQNIATSVIGREVSIDEPLMDAGLDSLSGQELKQQIEDEFGMDLPVTAAFDYPTIGALAGFVAGEIGGDESMTSEEEAQESRLTIVEVQARVSHITSGIIGREVDSHEPLMDAGLDSLSGQEMKQQIEDSFSIELPATAAFDYPTVHDLATFVAEETGATTVVIKKSKRSLNVASPLTKRVVARGFDLVAPRPPEADAIRKVPYQRWNNDLYAELMYDYHGRFLMMSGYNLHICAFSGMMDHYYEFDSTVFGISALEAGYMDVQQRSLLEGTLQATSGIPLFTSPDSPEGSSVTGVYVGIASCDYADEVLRRYDGSLNPYMVTGSSLNVASGRISFVYNFRGPCISMDTACSSSIVSTHQAFSGIRTNETVRALSCGVQAILSEHVVGIFHSSGMLALDGRCKTCDASANGYVRAEARGVLTLEAMDAGSASGLSDVTISGAAANQDGRSSALTAPNGPTQKVVVLTALAVAGATSRDLNVLQMHGTGTPLGDPIELGAALSALVRSPVDTAPTFEAVKSHVGHSETAAGIVSTLHEIMKLLQASSSLIFHLRTLNQHLLGLFTTTTVARLTRQRASRAVALVGVSGFAFQGTNAHVILKAPPSEQSAPGRRNRLFCRSRFWPLPELHPNIFTFGGTRDASIVFNARVDPRWHLCALGCETKLRELIVSSGDFLELACATSRLFSSESMACKNAIFTPLALQKDAVTNMFVVIDAQSGLVSVQQDSFVGAEANMRCRLHQTFAAPRTKCAVCSWIPMSARDRSRNLVRARVRALTKYSHFQRHVDPCGLESALSARSAMSAPGILRACARYWVKSEITDDRTLDVCASLSSDGVGCGGAHLTGAVYRKQFDKVFRVIPTLNESAARRLIDHHAANESRIESIESVQCKVRAHCARISGVDAIIGSEALSDLGMDSLAASELRAAVQNDFGLLLPIQAAFECPTPDSLAEYVVRESKRNQDTLQESRESARDEKAQPPILVFIFALVALLVSSIFYISRMRS